MQFVIIFSYEGVILLKNLNMVSGLYLFIQGMQGGFQALYSIFVCGGGIAFCCKLQYHILLLFF